MRILYLPDAESQGEVRDVASDLATMQALVSLGDAPAWVEAIRICPEQWMILGNEEGMIHYPINRRFDLGDRMVTTYGPLVIAGHQGDEWTSLSDAALAAWQQRLHG